MKKRSAQVIRTKISFSSKICSAKVIMTKNRSFQIILDPIENRSAWGRSVLGTTVFEMSDSLKNLRAYNKEHIFTPFIFFEHV